MRPVTLIAVGDISLQTRDNKHPFENVLPVLENKDILFGNLETVLSESGEEAEKAVLLRTSPRDAGYLTDAGFDVLNIANNHILDLGTDGFHNTLAALRENGLTFVGASDKQDPSYTVIEKQGVRFGFLAYCEGGISLPEKRVWVNTIDPEVMERDIALAKLECDVVVLSLHWGTENVFYPSPKQIRLAHKLIDAGATVILGHHPHVIQGIERYEDGLIAYSLGNFQFNPGKSKRTMMLRLGFSGKQFLDYHVIPAVIGDDFRPTLSNEVEFSEFMESISQPIESGMVTERWWFEQIAPEYLSGNLRSFVARIRRYGAKHLIQCAVWLIRPFCLRCYAAMLRSKFRSLLRRA